MRDMGELGAMATYLGDGAYAELTPIGLRLYTTDGIRETNSILLGDREYNALIEFVNKMIGK